MEKNNRRKFILGTLTFFVSACANSTKSAKIIDFVEYNETKFDDNVSSEDINVSNNVANSIDDNKTAEIEEILPIEILMQPSKKLWLKNAHTQEIYEGVFKIGDKYIESELKKLDFIFRDWRANKVVEIDRKLYDVLADIQKEFGDMFFLNSGYRTARTNKKVGGVKRSQHSLKKAGDIAVKKDLHKLYKIAKKKSKIGLGYYKGRFIHIDVRGYSARWIK